MAQLTVELPDAVLTGIATLAARDEKGVEQVAAEQLVAANAETDARSPRNLTELIAFLDSQPPLSREDIEAFEKALSEKGPPLQDEVLFGDSDL